MISRDLNNLAIICSEVHSIVGIDTQEQSRIIKKIRKRPREAVITDLSASFVSDNPNDSESTENSVIVTEEGTLVEFRNFCTQNGFSYSHALCDFRIGQ